MPRLELNRGTQSYAHHPLDNTPPTAAHTYFLFATSASLPDRPVTSMFGIVEATESGRHFSFRAARLDSQNRS